MKSNFLIRNIIFLEIATGITLVFFLWLEEYMDLPHLILRAAPTPINWNENLLEAIVVFLIILCITRITMVLLKRIHHLEGFLRVCSFCHRIWVDGQWISLELYLHQKSDLRLTHGFCEECAQKHYPEYCKEEAIEATPPSPPE